ncbi:hypothetical protein S83_058388 [Arachis hypogaea]
MRLALFLQCLCLALLLIHPSVLGRLDHRRGRYSDSPIKPPPRPPKAPSHHP